MQHQEEQRTCPTNLQSLQRFGLLPLGGGPSRRCSSRAVLILWTTLAVMRAEIDFDAIEAELERRGVGL
jgi:hypothetical protein